MRNLRYILLILCLCPALMWAQRRFSASERWEYRLAGLSGFSNQDLGTATDVMLGLHASQYTGTHHMVGLSVEGAWTSFVGSMPAAKATPGGGAVGLHLLYELQYSGTLIQTGLGVCYQRVFTDNADTAIYHANMWAGSPPMMFTLRHQFTERRDMSQQIYAQLPLYAGHYIISPIGIGYFLAGVRVNYAMWSNTSVSMLGTTSGLYERYVGIWQQMPNHGFRENVPVERKGEPLKLKFDILAHVEMGYEYTSAQSTYKYRYKHRKGEMMDIRMRFAGFADFGILDICPNTEKIYYGIPDQTVYDFPTYEMNHVFSTKDASRYWMRNLFIGIRFTVLFGFEGKERCILCDPWRH
jgi:hypothetical protein